MNRAMKIMLGVGIGCILSGGVFSGAVLAFSPEVLQEIEMKNPIWHMVWEQTTGRFWHSTDDMDVLEEIEETVVFSYEDEIDEWSDSYEKGMDEWADSFEQGMDEWAGSFEKGMDEWTGSLEDGIDEWAGSLEKGLNRWEKQWEEDWEENKKSQSEMKKYETFAEGDTFSGIQELDLETRHWKISVVADDSVDNVTIMKYQANGHEELRLRVKGDTLKIYDPETAKRNTKTITESIKQNIKNKTITLSNSLVPKEEDLGILEICVPKGTKYDKIDLNIESGIFLGDRLDVDELDVASIGQVEFSACEVKELDAEVMGMFFYQGSVGEEIDVQCVTSEVSFLLEGKKEDFKYNVESVTGKIEIDGEVKSGAVFQIKDTQKGSKEFDVESVASDIVIAFQ